MTVSQASGERTTAGRIKSLKDGYGVVLDTIFPLHLTRELGPRLEGRKQVRTLLRDKRREEDVNALISSFSGCSGSREPFAADSVPTPRQDLVTARVGELVGRSLRRSRSQDSEWPFSDAAGKSVWREFPTWTKLWLPIGGVICTLCAPS